MSPSRHFTRVVLLLAAVAWPGNCADIQCYSSRCGNGGLVVVDSVRECCVDGAGLQFELSPTAESCLRCEVVGWRNKTAIATEGSSVSLFFGYRKGTPSAPRQFQVEVSGDANYTVEPDPSNIEIGAHDGNVTLHLGIHSTAEQSPPNRTVTLTLTGPLFEDVNRIIFPSEMTLIVVHVVPRVQFERSHYYANIGSSDAVSICLVYDYTPAAGSAVDVTVSKEDDVNDVFFSRKFEFSSDSTKSCQEISIPRDKLDSKMDSVFVISIETEPDSALVLGAVSTATLTVAADGVEGDKGEEEDNEEEEGSSGGKSNTEAALSDGSDGSDDSWIIAVAVVVPTVLVLGVAIAVVVVVGTVYYKDKHRA